MAKSLNQFNAEQSEIVQELQAQIQEKEKILKDYQKQHGKMELFFNSVKKSIRPLSSHPLVYEPTKGKKSTDTPLTAVMRISDGHMGEVVEPEEIEMFNAFNPEICQ